MSASFKKFLSSNRVTKRRATPTSSSSSPRRKSSTATPTRGSSGTSSPRRATPAASANELEDLFDDSVPLPSVSLATVLADPSLRDVPQALAWSLSHMFEPLPGEAVGRSLSEWARKVKGHRDCVPLVVSAGHISAVLSRTTPAAIERETSELCHGGTLRRVVVPKRGGSGEALVLAAELERMVRMAAGLSEATREAWGRWLKQNPAAMSIAVGAGKGSLSKEGDGITESMANELVRAGFLASAREVDVLANKGVGSRTADIGTLVSIAAAGKGGIEDVPCGTRGVAHVADREELRVAIPGHGVFLKLADGAVGRLTELLQKTHYKEAPESALRQRWDGGMATGSAGDRQNARGMNTSVPPYKLRKWKEFHGLTFEWVLLEAIGTGKVEVFETGSVGKGVRLIV